MCGVRNIPRPSSRQQPRTWNTLPRETCRHRYGPEAGFLVGEEVPDEVLFINVPIGLALLHGVEETPPLAGPNPSCTAVMRNPELAQHPFR